MEGSNVERGAPRSAGWAAAAAEGNWEGFAVIPFCLFIHHPRKQLDPVACVQIGRRQVQTTSKE